jgi:hypothetical protein
VTVCKNSVKLLLRTKSLSPKGCEFIMTEKFMGIDIEVTENNGLETPFAGLIPLLQMCNAMNLPEIIDKSLHVQGTKGFRDHEYIMSLATMQIAEGSTLDDLAIFKEKFGLNVLPFRIPSPSAGRGYLAHFHNIAEESKQKQGSSYIPEDNEHLAGFKDIHAFCFKQAVKISPLSSITLDQDATFINTDTKSALFNYHGEKSYEALNTYCPEYDMVVGTQFRDGNVNPGDGQLEELKRVLSYVPVGIDKVRLRSDSAGYQVELLKYCCEGKNERFGVIDFTISCPVTKEFREAVKAVASKEWKPVMKEINCGGRRMLQETNQEYATISYVPQWAGNSKNACEYRYIAVREKFRGKLSSKSSEGQLLIPEMIEDMEAENVNMKKLHLTEITGEVYKIFGLVTNMIEKDGGELVVWHHERCGKSEELHRILKNEMAGGHIASRKFGANAAWWNIAVLAQSLLSLFKQYFLPEECKRSRPKTLRFQFFVTLGRIVAHARRIVLKIQAGKATEWFMYARDRLMSFCAAAG